MSVAGGGDVSSLLRELDDLRRRERAQCEELARRERRTVRLGRYSTALRSLSRTGSPSPGDLRRTLAEIARLSSEALEVERVGIWLFDEARERLNCTALLVNGQEQSTEGHAIEAGAFPRYFKALLEGESLAVQDARHDYRTREFAAYFERFDLQALLDVPILTAAGIAGVLRYSQVGRLRAWERAEEDFAAAVGDRIAVALESERRSVAENEARDTAAKYQHLVESLPVTVYSFDLRTRRFDYLSPQVYELGGWTAERWLNEGSFERWIEQVHPDDRQMVWEAKREAALGATPGELVYRVRLDDRTLRWVRDNRNIVRDHAGVPIFIQGVLADITNLKESEIYGSELERGFRSLLENVDILAMILDTDGRLEFANERFVQVSGYERAQLLGRDFFESMVVEAESDELTVSYGEAMSAGIIAPHFESTLRTQNGAERRVLWTNEILKRPDGSIQGVACLGLDLTDRLRFKQELLQQSKLESLGRLAAGVAHDFNNLLTVMMGEVALLADRPSAQTLSTAREVLEPALRQAADLTSALLTYARKQPVSPVRVSIDALLGDEAALLGALSGKAVDLTISKGAGEDRVFVDPSLLRQVVFNLVSNASDATHGRGNRISIVTGVEYVSDFTARQHGADHGGSYVTLSVTDDGPGMGAATMAQIFEPFFSTKPQGRTSGLGLSMCEGIVRRAGGFITVDSELGRGSTFRVYLPDASVESQIPVSRDAASRPSHLRNVRSVLVVQQGGPTRRALVEWLASAGYRVFTAADTKSAADILSDRRVELLIAEDTLPDGVGSVLLRSARAVHSDVRTLLLTTTEQAFEGIDSVLARPFDSEQFLRAVEGALATSTQSPG